MTQARFIGVYCLLAAAYVGTLPFQPFPGDAAVKALPILLLFGWAVKNRSGLAFAGALLFSAGGDVVLNLNGGGWFAQGLGLFLVAHLCYITAFAPFTTFEKKRLPAVLTIVVSALALVVLLVPHLGPLRYPVFAYVGVLTAMAVTANLTPGRFAPLHVGAAVFVVSDALIAINRFLVPVPGRSFWVMTTYYVAQICIVIGFLGGRKDSGS